VGDRLLYYVTGRMGFAATVTVASPMYEDHTPIWRSSRRDEDYPWRVHIRQDFVLDESDWVPAKEIAYRLDYVRKWPPEHWTLAFQGHIHALPKADFAIIEDEIARSSRRRKALAGSWRCSSASITSIFKTSAGSACSWRRWRFSSLSGSCEASRI
jgi:hypothetical protein